MILTYKASKYNMQPEDLLIIYLADSSYTLHVLDLLVKYQLSLKWEWLNAKHELLALS